MHFWEYSAAEGACILDFGRKAGTMGHILWKMSALEALGLLIRAFSAVLRACGLRDAEYSGICTPPPGVPVGKKQPPRRNMHFSVRFMQYSGCGCACRSAFLPTDATSYVALNVFGETVKVVERDHVIGKQVGNLIMHGAAANIVC